jgi:hypothetical protein
MSNNSAEVREYTLAKELQLQLQRHASQSWKSSSYQKDQNFRFTTHHEASNIYTELEVTNGLMLGRVGNAIIKFGATSSVDLEKGATWADLQLTYDLISTQYVRQWAANSASRESGLC